MRLIPILAAAAGLTALAACDVEQTQEGELPEVTATEGELPAYDVETENVTVDTTEAEITVPEIETQQETVEVPEVGVQE